MKTMKIQEVLNLMEFQNINLLMEIIMKVNLRKENLMEKENSFKIMAKQYMKENSKMISSMEKESL